MLIDSRVITSNIGGGSGQKVGIVDSNREVSGLDSLAHTTRLLCFQPGPMPGSYR